jgi:4-hydroxy-tetrahydrodipicolinate synthase
MPIGSKVAGLKEMRGPVFPIPTPFNRAGDVDHKSIENYVSFLLDKGVRNLMVTVGTSRFDVLTVDEMKAVNETVVRSAGHRAVTIVTAPTKGPTSQSVDFAVHAGQIGADGVLAVYPDRFYSDDDVFGFFEDVATAASVGVLVHLMPIRSGRSGIGAQSHYSLALTARIASIENIVGIKEESHDAELSYKYNRDLGDEVVIIGGAGGMRAYLTAHQWGEPAYLVGIGSFMPEIELAFYAALENGDYEKARTIVFEKEAPFFDAAVTVGWHLALKEAMSCRGLMPAWERRPMQRLSGRDRRLIREKAHSI